MPLYREKRRGGILGIIDRLTLGAIFKREADNLLIKFGLKEDRITSLSGGNQQKVLIGRGFAMRPDIIVLNDPARGIDVGAKAELYKHLRSFAEDGRSVVYMSSELEEFLGFATRVIVFRDGAPFDAFDGSRLDPKVVLEAMFGQTNGEGLTAAYGLQPGRAMPQRDRRPQRTVCACWWMCRRTSRLPYARHAPKPPMPGRKPQCRGPPNCPSRSASSNLTHRAKNAGATKMWVRGSDCGIHATA